MATTVESVASFIREEVSRITGRAAESLNNETPLIGPQRCVRSRELVELLLSVEEFAEDRMGVTFNWTDDSAMSEGRSIFRSIGTLAAHVTRLQKA